MNVEIKLDDPHLCDGCPLIGLESFNYEYLMCNLGYWHESTDRRYIDIGKRIRPKRCIKKYGR